MRDGTTSGSIGELPYINIDDMDDIPPIDKARLIEVDLLFEEPIDMSRLLISWFTWREKATLRLMCTANDERLKRQLKKKPEFRKRLINLLINCPKDRLKRKPFEGIEIASTETPKQLIPFIWQIVIWRDFLDIVRKHQGFNHGFGSGINSDDEHGCYYVYITDSCYFNIPREDSYVDLETGFDERDLAFINVQGRPHIEEDHVWWWLEQWKVQMVLLYVNTDKEVAAHYGYIKEYEAFLAKRKKEEKRKRERYKAFSEESRRKKEEKRKDDKQKLIEVFS